jgi:glycosyltransferase involved in cell wall biosynthesis
MASLAIVTSSPPGVEGGHLVIARALVQAAGEAGHTARLVVTPECTFGQQAWAYWEAFMTDLSDVDQVISLRFPSYAVRHRAHVCWLNHTMREYYDLWPEFSARLSWRARLKERAKRGVQRGVDRWLLHQNVRRVVAQSLTIQQRLAEDLGVHAEVLLPPPPQRPYRCDGYGDFIFAVSRLTPHKRLHLLIDALALPVARQVRAVVAGEGPERAALERLVADRGLSGRVTFLGRVDDATLVDHYARCRAVCFPPLDEDYGFVTVEAFASAKAVVTCADSGGPAALIRDGGTGLICDPSATSLAIALARLADDRGFAERLGRSAATVAATMTWADAVSRLVIV